MVREAGRRSRAVFRQQMKRSGAGTAKRARCKRGPNRTGPNEIPGAGPFEPAASGRPDKFEKPKSRNRPGSTGRGQRWPGPAAIVRISGGGCRGSRVRTRCDARVGAAGAGAGPGGGPAGAHRRRRCAGMLRLLPAACLCLFSFFENRMHVPPHFFARCVADARSSPEGREQRKECCHRWARAEKPHQSA
jgi:hypothetical protein